MVKMPHWPVPVGMRPIDLQLSRIKLLLSNLGDPHQNLPPVIHFAGTNGKGSTIAILQAILENAGYSVHRYTSPHLIDFNERIVLAGREIEDGYLNELAEECRHAAEDELITFFEGTTALAFLAFSRIKADILLLETGLGGRLDATNVIDNPALSVITPISLDHMEYLGDTLQKIAFEKAGIIKQNTPCVISWQHAEVNAVLSQRCKELKSPYFAYGEHWDTHTNGDNQFVFQYSEDSLLFPRPSLTGLHQIINAATAIATLHCLDGYNVGHDNISAGLRATSWPARLQKIDKGTLYALLPDNMQLWLDGAHNPAGGQMLAANLDLIKSTQDELVYMINGRTKNRDIEGFLQFFVNKIDLLIAIPVISEPLSERPEVIQKKGLEIGFQAFCCSDIKEAVQLCIRKAAGRQCTILACGSLYLAADIILANKDL